METRQLLCVVLLSWSICAQAIDLTQSTITEVVNDVKLKTTAAPAATPAQTNVILKNPDQLRTGAASRAELTASDQTITRVGSNTVFSFEATGRNINLEQGSMLFHAPKGKGGGVIKSGGASAAVLGTTIIVSYSAQSGFKVVVLEGDAKVSLADGNYKIIHAGQLIIVLPGAMSFGELQAIDLAALISGSNLVSGFSHELPSMGLIKLAITTQQGTSPLEDFSGSNPGPDLDNNTYRGGPASPARSGSPAFGFQPP